jgi:hypothetical protein
METVPQALTDAQVLDEEGQPHPLGELWHNRPAVILFVRHFG